VTVGDTTSFNRQTTNEREIAVNTSTTASTQSWELGLGYSEMFVLAPLELDYDEPNAVVSEDQEMDFVTSNQHVTAVQLPVVCEVTEEIVPMSTQQPEPTVVLPVQSPVRTAA
jgi:hypothetical protein